MTGETEITGRYKELTQDASGRGTQGGMITES